MEGRYKRFLAGHSAAVVSVLEASKNGTIDRRTVEEHLRDIEELNQQNVSIRFQARDLILAEYLGKETCI